MRYRLDESQCRNLEVSQQREWLLTNGRGGFAMGTASGINTRRYHGHLVAAIDPPGGRMVLLAGIDAFVQTSGNPQGISTNAYPDAIYPEGYRYATEFSVEFGIRVAGGTYWHVVPEVIGPLLERQSGLMHACEAETSLMMHLSPSSVRTERLAEAYGPGSTRVEGQPPGLLMRRSFQALSPSGVFGDARLATAAKGEKLLAAIADKLAETLANTKLWA
jgi:hypothetical protein